MGSKRISWETEAKLNKSFKFKIFDLNFNTANFLKDAGYDKKDYEKRIHRLGKLLAILAKDGVVVINLQEISSLFINAEKIRFMLLEYLFTVSESWTATGPTGRNGNYKANFNLITFWNADVLHMNEIKNFHYNEKENGNGEAGDMYCGTQKVYSPGNALIIDFSFTVPNEEAGETDLKETYHHEGFSIDNKAKFLNINTHFPVRPQIKNKCLEKLFTFIKSYKNIDDYFVSIMGDFNIFVPLVGGDLTEAKLMIDNMLKFGEIGVKQHKDGSYCYETLGGKQRSITYIPTKYDITNSMKLFDPDKCDADKKKYYMYAHTDHDGFMKNFPEYASLALPMDWTIFKPTKWCRPITTNLIDFEDLSKLLKDSVTDGDLSKNNSPDYGNFLSDHFPIISTLYVDHTKLYS